MMLDDDKKRYGYKDGGPGIEALRKEAPEVVERMGYAEGTSPEKRYESFIKRDIDNLKEYGDKYFNSGTGFFKGIKQSLGDFGRGERLLDDLKSVRNQMQDDRTDAELLSMINTRFKNAGLDYTVSDEFIDREQKAEGGSLLQDDMAMLQEKEMPTHTMPDGTVMPGATHEEGEMMMEESVEPEMKMESETPMESDSEMEDNYLDFIIDEALSEEEEDMLMSKLEQDEELSMLFDKVIEVASEFAGSGPVEGPGTGVSDSIPARLSDGEFVFTAKAVEEIGADNLMAMMKEAEMKADERQGMVEGGIATTDDEEETMQVTETRPTQDIRVTSVTTGPQASQQEYKDLVGEELKKSMINKSYNI